jgi:hypothetical protein
MEIADSLLTQIARELMGASRVLPKEPPVLAGAEDMAKKQSAARPRRSK